MIFLLFSVGVFSFIAFVGGMRQRRHRARALGVSAALLRDCPCCLSRVPKQASVCAACHRDIPPLPVSPDDLARALASPPSLMSGLIHAPRPGKRWKGLLR